jgi:raffinose/stachyose/melibiose transport system substrate-binding protein
MLKQKKSFFISLFLVVFIALSGCQSPTASNQTNESTNDNDKSQQQDENNEKVLNVLVPNYYNNDEKIIWEKVVEDFKNLHPDIKVELEAGDVSVESGSLTTKLNSGMTPPDVILINAGPGRVNLLSNAQMIMPLDELYAKNQWKEKVRSNAYELVSGGENVYELPYTLDANLVFYNKDIFEKYGLEVPKTKDEFLNILETLKSNGERPITIGARDAASVGWLFGKVLESVAGTKEVENTLYGDGKWNDPEFIKAAETMEGWAKDKYIIEEALTLTYADSVYQFLDKKAAMEIGGTRKIIDIMAANVEDSVGAFVLPSFIDGEVARPAGGVGLTWVVPTNAADVDLAETWLNYMLSEDHNKLTLSLPDYNFIPAAEVSREIKPSGAILDSAIQSMEVGSGYNPSVFIGVQTKEAYYQNLQGILGGLISAEEAMNNIEAAAEIDRKAGFNLSK